MFFLIIFFYIPAEWIAKIPPYAQVTLSGGIVLAFYYSLQWEYIKNEINERKGSNWRLLGIALTVIVLQLVFAFIFFATIENIF